jgi:hypothetical protein
VKTRFQAFAFKWVNLCRYSEIHAVKSGGKTCEAAKEDITKKLAAAKEL